MAPWHCPHCGALQAETARCWVCRRSSTTCSTCRNFRRSLATDVGYCALDRRRRPLTGLELRGCWAGHGVNPESATAAASAAQPARAPLRGFVPLEDLMLAPIAPVTPAAAAVLSAVSVPTPAMSFVEAREAPTSLFGDLDR